MSKITGLWLPTLMIGAGWILVIKVLLSGWDFLDKFTADQIFVISFIVLVDLSSVEGARYYDYSIAMLIPGLLMILLSGSASLLATQGHWKGITLDGLTLISGVIFASSMHTVSTDGIVGAGFWILMTGAGLFLLSALIRGWQGVTMHNPQ